MRSLMRRGSILNIIFQPEHYLKTILLAICLIAVSHPAKCEGVTDSDLNLSLGKILNIKLVTASKKTENLFESPLSASVLTREEIIKSGATSIQEALRLVPGIFAVQPTNGNFEITS